MRPGLMLSLRLSLAAERSGEGSLCYRDVCCCVKVRLQRVAVHLLYDGAGDPAVSAACVVVVFVSRSMSAGRFPAAARSHPAQAGGVC
jgi:hypothetical protein